MAIHNQAESVLFPDGQRTLWRFSGWGLLARVVLLAILFVLELIPVSHFIVDRRGNAGRQLEQWVVTFAAILAALLYLKARRLLQEVSTQLPTTRFMWGFLASHLAAIVVLIGLSCLPVGTHPVLLIKAGRILASLLAVAFGVFAFVPPKFCFALIRAAGVLWAYASAASGVVCLLANFSWSLWRPATYLTFAVVRAILGLFSSSVVADPAASTIGTQGFSVGIAATCSGLEGVGLMLVFSVGWLWFFRHECRFPQALLLIPAGLLTIWLLNAVRIAVLILIGDAGAPNVAVGGFHSQAGWIAFNAVALGFSLVARRLRWVTVSGPERPHDDRSAENPTAMYLMPFLAILAAGMISQAASGTFEWLYPLRFLAAAATLWFFRSRYARLDWRFGAVALLIGGVVFLLWWALDLATGTHTDNGISAGLARWPGSARMVWLAVRTVAAVVTVPIAEELAFRGFLIRRLMSRDFESIDPRTFTYVSVLVSSVAFGLLHGERWLAGIVAGLFYSAAYLFRGRIGDAVAAHGTTNALIAAYVLFRGKWYLW